MIHPHLATMLAVVTTDYPLEPARRTASCAPAVDASFNRISVDGECSTNDAVLLLANGASGIERTPATDARVRAGARRGLRRPRAADRRRRRGRDAARSRSQSPARRAAGEANAIARRIATSPLVKTAALRPRPNWGRILAAAGSALCNGGFAAGRRRPARRCSINGVTVFAAASRPAPSPSLEGAVCRDRARSRARRRVRQLPRPPTSPTTTSGSTRSTRREPRRRQGRRRRRGEARRPTCSTLAAAGHEVIVVHGAGPQITAEMARRGLAVDVRRAAGA